MRHGRTTYARRGRFGFRRAQDLRAAQPRNSRTVSREAGTELAAGRDQLDHRQVYGSIFIAGRQLTLLYAGANGPAVTSLLTETAASAARSSGFSFQARDVDPVSSGDTRGLAVFYAAFGLVLADSCSAR